MKKLAVDIVLLPPESAMKKVISLIDYQPDSVIRLNTHDCLPHISLAMGVLQGDQLREASRVLQDVASRFKTIELALTHTQNNQIANGKYIADARFEHSRQLEELHLSVMDAFRPLLTHDNVQTDMFYSPPAVAEISTTWVSRYYDKKKPSNFHPHITLGEGETQQPKIPLIFSADRLALCHLGSYCTCRSVLAEVKIT